MSQMSGVHGCGVRRAKVLPDPPGEVPPLTGCVNDAGTLIVLPTDDQGICEQLDMAVYAPASKATNSMIEVENRLVEQINPHVCPSFDDARRITEDALTDAGIDDWTVAVSQPPTDQRPCPSLSFENVVATRDSADSPMTSEPRASDCGSKGWGFESSGRAERNLDHGGDPVTSRRDGARRRG